MPDPKQSKPKEPLLKGDESIILDEEDEAILDQVWDELFGDKTQDTTKTGK